MLSIGKLTSDRVGYYEQAVAQGRDDYYSGKGEAAGEWLGEGAEVLGLEGDVGSIEFERLMAGNHPETAKPLAEKGRGGRRVAAYDLTFSAPKSLSVLYAIGGEETSLALREAHDEAVRAAVGYLEAEACMVRRGAGGAELIPAGGFVSAAYRHRMSRAEDPQLHTHVVTANVVRGADGRWSGLWGTPLYRSAKAAGYLYQAHLRSAVRERLAWVRWSAPEKGQADIEGVSESLLREFSKRRTQIEEWLASEGRAGRNSAQKAALATRPRKEHEVESSSWRERIRARAAELGLGRAELAQLAGRSRGAHAPVDEDGLARRLSGPHGLTAQQNTFGARDVAIAVAASHRDGIAVSEARANVGGYLEREEAVPTSLESGEQRFTTADLVRSEREIVDGAARRKGEGAPMVDRSTLETVLADREVRLSDEQRAVVEELATSPNGFDTVEALAGTGKTTLAGTLRELYEVIGVRVVGAAPTARAARELAERGGIAGSQTLARLRMELERTGGFGAGLAVLIVDEASMAATRDIAAIAAEAERAKVKVIAIGDSGQLPSVSAGGWLGSLSRRQGSSRLSEVMRQRDPAERRLLARVHAGEPAAYVRRKSASGDLSVHDGGPAGEAALLSEWWRAQSALPAGEAVMIVRDNATRERLNAAARAELRAAGHLGPSLEAGGRELAVGDRVIARRNDRGHDVDNGMRATVRAVDRGHEKFVVETDASGVRELPLSYAADHLEHAYALTGHGMQGGTVEWAGVIGIPSDFSRNWSYTALSRARETTSIHLVDEPTRLQDERAEIAPAEVRAAGLDPLVRMERRMRVRDDEDLALDYLLPPSVPGGTRAAEGVELPEAGAACLDAAARTSASADAIRRELAELDAKLASFPLAEERALDRARQAREEARRTAQAARRRIRSRGDARGLARERQNLDQAERRLASVQEQEARLASRVPDRAAWEAEMEPLRERRSELSVEFASRREQWVEVAVAAPGRHLTDALGPRPADRRGARAWEGAARSIERYRFEQGVTGPQAIGAKPREREAQRQWRETSRKLERAQRQLGRQTRSIARTR